MRYVEGVNPNTGEILKVEVKGNFPFKNPETNEFIIDNAGQVITPGRERERFARLDSQRREIPDPRPMSSAVAFAFDVTPEEEVRRLIASADRRVLENYARADASDVDFYDDDFEVPEEGGVDNAQSPFEFVRDLVAGQDVPRGLKGMFKPSIEADSDGDVAEPLPPKGKAAKRAVKPSNDDSTPEGKDEGGQ